MSSQKPEREALLYGLQSESKPRFNTGMHSTLWCNEATTCDCRWNNFNLLLWQIYKRVIH